MSIANLKRSAQRIKFRRCWVYVRREQEVPGEPMWYRAGEVRDLTLTFTPITTSRSTMGLTYMLGADMSGTGVLMQTGDEELAAMTPMAQPQEVLGDNKIAFIKHGFAEYLEGQGAVNLNPDALDADVVETDLAGAGFSLVFSGVSFEIGGDIDLGGGESGLEITVTKALSLDDLAALTPGADLL